MDNQTAIEIMMLYNEGYTIKELNSKYGVSLRRIKALLVENNIPIQLGRKTGGLSDTHKKNISETRKAKKIPSGFKGKTATKDNLYKNMKAHLGWDVTLEWLMAFEEIDKLKFLNRSISRKRDKEGFTLDTYKGFIEKFYNDVKFNRLYSKWVETGDKWIKPSLDHINCKAKGGKLDCLNNLTFISWLENRAKVDMSQEEWDAIKNNISYYL